MEEAVEERWYELIAWLRSSLITYIQQWPLNS